MTISIAHRFDLATRVIDVSVTADPGKRLARVETTYDGFRLGFGSGDIHPPASSYSNSYNTQDAISPGRERVVVVNAWHTDGSTDSAQKRWFDVIG